MDITINNSIAKIKHPGSRAELNITSRRVPAARFALRFLFICIGVITLVIGLTGCALLPVGVVEKQIVVLWHNFTGVEAEALQSIADAFNAENSWDLILIPEYQQDLFDKVQVSPDSRPDLITVQIEDLPAYLSQGLIGARPGQSSNFMRYREDMLPMAAALYTVDGVMRALPLGMQTYVMYANREWLLDLGYPVEGASWQDLRRVACAATELQGGQVGLGIPAQPASLMAFLTASGSQIVDAEGFYAFADQPGLATADLLYELLAGECAVVYNDWDTGSKRLSKSSMAMIVESSRYLNEVERAVAKGRNFLLSVSVFPGPDGTGSSLWFGPGLAVVSSNAEREENALRVLDWFYAEQAQQYWSQQTAYLPVRRSLIEDELSVSESSTRSQLLEVVLDADSRGSWVRWPIFTNRMACRASLLRTLLLIGDKDSQPRDYINTTVTACNTTVQPIIQALPAREETP
jgi:ABC-type glycerol-3-phosphate transport system substrate-binding protein